MNIVIAGNYKQYKVWMLQNDLNPKEYVYAKYPEQLRGFKYCNYILVGDYWENEVFSSDIFIAMVLGGFLTETWIIKEEQ